MSEQYDAFTARVEKHGELTGCVDLANPIKRLEEETRKTAIGFKKLNIEIKKIRRALWTNGGKRK